MYISSESMSLSALKRIILTKLEMLCPPILMV